MNHCKTRSDEWVSSVQGRIEYFVVNSTLLTLYIIIVVMSIFALIEIFQCRIGQALVANGKKLGVQSTLTRNEHFKRCATTSKKMMKNNSQILLKKSEEYFEDPDCVPYLKSKLFEHYGDLFITESCGRQDIVTFREKTSKILRDYFNMPNKNDNEAQQRAIIEAAVKLKKVKSKLSFSH